MKYENIPLCRSSQYVLAKGQKMLRYGLPEVLAGRGSLSELPAKLKNDGVNKPMIVAGKTVSKNGILDGLLSSLENYGVEYIIFDGAAPNPTIDNVEDAVTMYNDNNCDCIIAVGGGSSMDCAKITAARLARPNKSVEDLKGTLKVRKKTPLLYTAPTTAGTGSETTIAAVVVNKETQHKYAVMDPVLLPHMAVLDPELTVSMPKSVTAATGMDALTHAVEAYINLYGQKVAYDYAKDAVKLVFENIKDAYEDGTNIEARENMLKASWLAGAAFTRNCVGYVHAIGHPLSGMYNLPHGQVMGSLLPVVLRAYGPIVYPKLAELGSLVGIAGKNDEMVAKKFIKTIETMNEEMGLPKKFHMIEYEHIGKMADFAIKESNMTYPTPSIWSKKKIMQVYKYMQGE